MSNIWPKADDYDERNALASVIWSWLPQDTPLVGALSSTLADQICAAGWRNLERFRHDVTNALGMAMVHEADDPDLGYDRGIVDAMDIVNGTEPCVDIHACRNCGHAAREHPFPDCEWWVGDEVRSTAAERIIAEGWMRIEAQRQEIARLQALLNKPCFECGHS